MAVSCMGGSETYFVRSGSDRGRLAADGSTDEQRDDRTLFLRDIKEMPQQSKQSLRRGELGVLPIIVVLLRVGEIGD